MSMMIDPYKFGGGGIPIAYGNVLLSIPFTETTAPAIGGRLVDAVKPEALSVVVSSRNTSIYKFSMGASWGTSGENGRMVSDAATWPMPDSLVFGTAFTHELWIYPTALPTTENIAVFCIRDNVYTNYLSPYQVALVCYINTIGGLTIALTNNSGFPSGGSGGTWVYCSSDSGSLFSINQWYHIRIVVSGGQMQLYLNGTARRATPYTIPTGHTLNGRTGLWFGNMWAYDASQNHRFQGLLQDYRALNIAANLTNFDVPTAPHQHF